MLVHQLQQPQLNLGLVQEGLFVLDDLDGHQFLSLMIIGFHHLQGQGTSQSERKLEMREQTESAPLFSLQLRRFTNITVTNRNSKLSAPNSQALVWKLNMK